MRPRPDFDGYVKVRSPHLLRLGYLLTHDWYTAEDLVQTALIKAWSYRRRGHLPARRLAPAPGYQIGGRFRPLWIVEREPRVDEPPGDHPSTLQ
jgi:hypothetical protein